MLDQDLMQRREGAPGEGSGKMAVSRGKKAEKVQLLAKELETSTTAIIGTFAKLTVAQDFALRKTIREAGGKYRVVKNKLAAISGEGTQVEAALKGLKGVSSVAFTSGDPVALAKGFAKWVERERGVSVQAGHRGRQAADGGRSQGAGDHAGQGRDLSPSCSSSSMLRHSGWQRCSMRRGATWRWFSARAWRKEKFAGAA